MEDLISVIVPIYNVENYLEKCIESILNQKYRNIEVLLIDDGSTDSSAIICDEFKKKDTRVVVFRRTNSGPSCTRNFGIENANGNYICFIDSDDVIHSDMIWNLYNLIKEHNADITCCRVIKSKNENKLYKAKKRKFEIIEYNSEKAIGNMLDDYGISIFSVNKLYKKSLFDNVRFPEGKIYEDIETLFHVFLNATKIIYLKQDLYFYRVRNNSVSNSVFSEKTFFLLESIERVRKFVETEYKNQITSLSGGYVSFYIKFLSNAYCNGLMLDEETRFLKRYIRKYFSYIFLNKNMYFYRKIQILFFAILPSNFYRSLYRTSKKMVKGF